MTECVRYMVSGRVQGVFFRAATRQKSMELGLRGRARNLADGCVEVIACGPAQRLAMLEQWLWDGPTHARVSGVDSEPAEDEGFADFETD